MIHQKYVDGYMRSATVINKERKQLFKYLKKYVLSDDRLHFDEKQIENFINFAEKWFFKIKPFQKFLIAFIFLYHEDGTNYYTDFLWLMGRGSGKNGLISAVALFLISELHGIRNYNGTIVANSEEQAKISVEEINDVINQFANPLKSAFYNTSSRIKSRKTNATLRYRTSNGNTKDGLRDGFVIFDEIHEYQDSKNVRVHISGLGKRPNARVFYIGTDGYVRDGFIDMKKKEARNVLDGKAAPDSMFPWICKLDDRSEKDDPKLWQKAVPIIAPPVTGYAKSLLRQIKRDYDHLVVEPSGEEEFLTKRMDIPSESMESSVAPWEEIAATNKPIPDDLTGREAVAAIDFATVRDFIAAAVTVKYHGKLVTLMHQWALKSFCDKYYGYSRKRDRPTPNKRIEIPLREWERRGLITIVDDNMVSPDYPIDWIEEMSQRFSIKTVVMDNFRATIYRKLLEDIGYDVMVIRSPSAIDGLLATIIDDGFPQGRFIWGDNPLLRWNTQNVKVKTDARGNKQYLKKEEVRRKTDGFKAWEYTLYALDKISDFDVDGFLDDVSSLNF